MPKRGFVPARQVKMMGNDAQHVDYLFTPSFFIKMLFFTAC